MSFNIDSWLSSITSQLKDEFNEELLFIGYNYSKIIEWSQNNI